MKPRELLATLNKEFNKTHTAYEELFWDYYMGDHSKGKAMDKALKERDAFRADPSWVERINDILPKANKKETKRLSHWLLFFSKYQVPQKALAIKNKVAELETKIHTIRESAKEGYVDPYTKKLVRASEMKLRSMLRAHPDQKIRKACWKALEKRAMLVVKEYVKLVTLRNQFARAVGYPNFYAYKLMVDEGMTLKDLFGLWDDIYAKTKGTLKEIRELEKEMPGARKPWNFSFLLSGDFTAEEDQYFQFEHALTWWGKSFSALGYGFEGGSVKLDLLDRQGKYGNGFCHYPKTVHEKEGKIIPGRAGFTTNLVPGQVGAGVLGMTTLFHEGAHACDRLNSKMPDACLNHEYAPASTAWAETHSMFADTMFSSIEWKMRYAKNAQGQPYPFSLYERKVRRLHPLRAMHIMSIMMVCDFERRVYTCKNLTTAKVKQFALQVNKKYFDFDPGSYSALNIPHIYSWDSSCYYQGYGLAELALTQWREYFYTKYGYIVDNPRVGGEVKKLWKLSSSKTFMEFVKMATGKKLSASDYVRNIMKSPQAKLKTSQKRIERLQKVPRYKKKINLNGHIEMWHGKKKICDNSKSFEDMAERYKEWLGKEAKRNT